MARPCAEGRSLDEHHLPPDSHRTGICGTVADIGHGDDLASDLCTLLCRATYPIFGAICSSTVMYFARCLTILEGGFRYRESRVELKVELRMSPTSAQVANRILPKEKPPLNMLR